MLSTNESMIYRFQAALFIHRGSLKPLQKVGRAFMPDKQGIFIFITPQIQKCRA